MGITVDTDAQSVRDALTALDDAFAGGDIPAVLSLCTEDVLFIGSGDGEEAVGREAIGPMFTALSAQLEGLKFSLVWDSVAVDVRGDLALLYARGSAALLTPRRDHKFTYRLTGVLVRMDGK